MEIKIDIKQQTLTVYYNEHKRLYTFLVSTAEKGIGQLKNSFQTPIGWHYVRAMIGANAPINSVFKSRRLTGEICTTELQERYPERDWILTRIIWLSGLESLVNRGSNVDTMRRYIYIHGCPDACLMGVPLSKGCIRMRNQDIILLFDMIEFGTKVHIF